MGAARDDTAAAGGSAPSQTPGLQGRRLVLEREQPSTHSASPEPNHLLAAMDRQDPGPWTMQINPATPTSPSVPVVGVGTARPLLDPHIQPGVIHVVWV